MAGKNDTVFEALKYFEFFLETGTYCEEIPPEEMPPWTEKEREDARKVLEELAEMGEITLVGFEQKIISVRDKE